jgi:hypothetical protein
VLEKVCDAMLASWLIPKETKKLCSGKTLIR